MVIEESKAMLLHEFVAFRQFQIFAHHLAYKFAECCLRYPS
jgi:hypothetical protein